ncbi:hypothetical protein [Phascolarctobacterium succinatutens]|jgi:hypothetical protein|uniref:Uncharacterized protein n=1 Tax=Phascolarctobacterium succinatutens TaxID=626940 RepID=A0A1Q6R2W3_9FIRM|nr:hypothetical protein [Phascolarctobacterium succinatutens]OLA36721.1 MAG: hypothetical protein BHW43_08775 [Phascolarctobacterium succinatutens]
MDLELLSFLISGLAFAGAWLIVQPQRVENDALHQSIDNNTLAVKELTKVINDIRVAQATTEEQLNSLLLRYQEVKREVDDVRKCCCSKGVDD